MDRGLARTDAEEWGIGGMSRPALRGLERAVRLDHGRADSGGVAGGAANCLVSHMNFLQSCILFGFNINGLGSRSVNRPSSTLDRS